MRIIRGVLGALILLFDRLFTPKGIQRQPDQQEAINTQTRALVLYQYKACPFCVKVRRAIKRLSLSIETRDAKRCDTAKAELLAGGGQLKVPCLRIDDGAGQVRWLYESSDIISYLQQRYADTH